MPQVEGPRFSLYGAPRPSAALRSVRPHSALVASAIDIGGEEIRSGEARRGPNAASRSAGPRLKLRFLIVVFVGAAVLLSADSAVAGELCDQARQLAVGHRLDLAQTLYARAAAASEGTCADLGLVEVGRLRGESAAAVARGQALEATKITPEALAAYLEALAKDASNTVAAERITALMKPAPADQSPFAPALALSRAGFSAAAADALKDALKTSGDAPVPQELKYLAADPPELVRDAVRAAQPAGVFTLQVVAVIVGLLLGVPILWRVASRYRRRIDVDDFEDKTAAPTQVGTAIARIVENELASLRREGGGAGLRLVETPDPKIDLPSEVSDAVPAAKPVAALLGLLPSRVDVIRGELLPAGTAGVGLSVSLVSGGSRAISSITLWKRDFDPTWSPPPQKPGASTEKPDASAPKSGDALMIEAYYRLALVAAAWALYALPLSGDAYRQARLLTDDWRSYALFRLGAATDAAGSPTKARQLYVMALGEDPSNRGALFNLGVLDVTNRGGAPGTAPTAEQYQRGLGRLELARKHLQKADRNAGVRPPFDRLWYRASYNIAATHFHWWLANSAHSVARGGKAGPMPDLSLAEVEAVRVVHTAAGTIELLGDAPEWQALRRFLATVEEAGVVLLADIETRADWPPRPAPASA